MDRSLTVSLVICVFIGIVIGMLIGLLLKTSEAEAADAAQYLPCTTLKCVDDRLIAVLSRIDKAEAEVRMAAEADRQFKAITEQRIADIAWSKASDRLDLFKRESSAYTDRWFYDEDWRRGIKLLCYAGVNTNARITCPK